MEGATRNAPDLTRPRGDRRLRLDDARAWFGGGIDGNEELTAIAGVILIILFAVLGVTIVQIRQLIWLHLFLGLLLLGPVTLKLASTGYRFARYYLHNAAYVAKGPPVLALRAMGPLLVVLTAVVFASGIVLLLEGPRNRATMLSIHKVSFIAWVVLFGLHILAHLPGLPQALRAAKVGASESPLEGSGGGGAAGRWLALVGTLVLGAVLAIVLIPHFSVWTAPGAFPHHHHDG
jgi:hypothetical protein